MEFTLSLKNSILQIFLLYVHSCFSFKAWYSVLFFLDAPVPPTTHPRQKAKPKPAHILYLKKNIRTIIREN